MRSQLARHAGDRGVWADLLASQRRGVGCLSPPDTARVQEVPAVRSHPFRRDHRQAMPRPRDHLRTAYRRRRRHWPTYRSRRRNYRRLKPFGPPAARRERGLPERAGSGPFPFGLPPSVALSPTGQTPAGFRWATSSLPRFITTRLTAAPAFPQDDLACPEDTHTFFPRQPAPALSPAGFARQDGFAPQPLSPRTLRCLSPPTQC